MTGVEFRKLGGGAGPNSVSLPVEFMRRFGWKRGDYLVIELDELRHELVLRKAKDR